MLPHRVRRLLRLRFTREQLAREIEEELAHHVERRAAALMQEGLAREDAYAEASRRFGDAISMRDECLVEDLAAVRRNTMTTWFEQLRGDVRFAARSLRRTPGFSIVALGTIILGITAFTSIFSYFNAVYYAELPYHDAPRIAAISEEYPRGYSNFSSVSRFGLTTLRRDARSFERLTAYDEGVGTVLYGRDAVQLRTIHVDTGFIPLFDLRPQVGRLLSREEITSDAPVVMISDLLWRTRYGGDSAALGKMISLNDRSYAIVGVLPPEFRFPYQTDVLMPFREQVEEGGPRRETSVDVLGKLRVGLTHETARAELQTIATRLGAENKPYRNVRFVLRDEMLDRRAQNFLPVPGVFLGAGLFLLLIACANVTSLFYVRAADRQGEMAIRASLGAARSRLIRQSLAEGLVISTIAAVIGTWLSTLVIKLWLHFVPTSGFPSWFRVTLDVRVLLMAIGVTALVTLVVGLSPALEGTRFDLVSALKGATDFGSSSRAATRGSKRALIVQLGMSVALFIAAALLTRSFQRLTTIDVGYPAARIATVSPLYDGKVYEEPASRVRFAERMATEALSIPGVQRTAIRGFFSQLRAESPGAVAFTQAPFDSRLIPDGDTTRAVRLGELTMMYTVSHAYFDLLALRIRSGRGFSDGDIATGPAVAVISATAAKKVFGDASPLGRSIQRGVRGERLVVVGIVDDVRDLRGGRRGFRNDPGVTIYLSAKQALTSYPEILATGTGDALAFHSMIAEQVQRADPLLVLLRNTTLANQLDEAFLVTRVFGGIIGAFAASALALSIIGIYGVVAFGISRRTREIGIRIALGGTTQRIIQLVTVETLRFVTIGLLLGLGLALALGRVLKIFLFEVSPLDPVTYALVVIGFGAVAAISSYLPARRITRVDPLKALRAE
jgi:putative ABC transport system permease protein